MAVLENLIKGEGDHKATRLSSTRGFPAALAQICTRMFLHFTKRKVSVISPSVAILMCWRKHLQNVFFFAYNKYGQMTQTCVTISLKKPKAVNQFFIFKKILKYNQDIMKCIYSVECYIITKTIYTYSLLFSFFIYMPVLCLKVYL